MSAIARRFGSDKLVLTRAIADSEFTNWTSTTTALVLHGGRKQRPKSRIASRRNTVAILADEATPQSMPKTRRAKWDGTAHRWLQPQMLKAPRAITAPRWSPRCDDLRASVISGSAAAVDAATSALCRLHAF